jgi:hypothetical protein
MDKTPRNITLQCYKLDLIKKSPCEQSEKTMCSWGKEFANHMFNRGLYLCYIKIFKSQYWNSPNNSIRKRAKYILPKLIYRSKKVHRFNTISHQGWLIKIKAIVKTNN